MEAQILLVDGIHGINAIKSLLKNYQDRLYKQSLVSTAFSLVKDDYFLEDDIELGVIYIKSDSGEFWRVEFNDGDIIAVNLESEWCDICERYELSLDDNITVYQVAEHYLPAIINNDYTGLNDDEEKILNRFIENETNGLDNFHWSYNSEHRHEFVTCEITGEVSHCIELHLVNMS